MKKILVIGGAGYLGAQLCQQLLDAGYAVKSVDAEWFGEMGPNRLREYPAYERVKLDIRQIATLPHIVRGCDAVIHLAGIVGDPACAIDEDFTYSCNFLSTVTLANVCKRAGIRRFLFASSCSVYGKTEEPMVHERSGTNPLSLYARDKLMCEAALMAMHDDTFSPTMLRLSTLFGWSPRMRFDLVVNLLTARAAHGATLEIHGGSQWRPFVHVNDAAAAFVAALTAPLADVSGQIFNVGAASNNHRIIDVARAIHDSHPGTEITIIPQMIDERDYSVSFDKIETTLGYRARVDLRQGIGEMLAQLAAHGPMNLLQPCFSNVKRTQEVFSVHAQSLELQTA
ncbi:NAD-dependent epimerase/dehydratase family protein [Pseudoduganella armeniaca]|uniref:NAD-dependent epimerase/dehydratase domain-containing protein n=1 Tax=Pseudoduganella armeniaca TaxID=2072590 RepID=A0A2R4CHB6_9BURK|nr:SDR family oxidoreductase [Pseudoduganella armeniaca]AVR98922.1 hypothetical protein C9I28_27345 [Pseudoduganella armeniaca]